MSLSPIGFGVGIGLIPIVILLIVFASDAYDKKKPHRRYAWAAAILSAIAIFSIVIGTWSYNSNIRQSHVNCIERGGYISSGKCVDRLPVEIQRL